MENKTKVIIGVSAAAILIGAVVGILVFKPKNGKEIPARKPAPSSKKAYAKGGEKIYTDMYKTDMFYYTDNNMPLELIGECDDITGVCKVKYSHFMAGDNVTGYILKSNIIYK